MIGVPLVAYQCKYCPEQWIGYNSDKNHTLLKDGYCLRHNGGTSTGGTITTSRRPVWR